MKTVKKLAFFLLTAAFISSVSTGFAMQVFEKNSGFEDYGCDCGKKKKGKGKWDE